MFGAATFHAAMAEIVVGCMVLASLCAIGCATGSIMPNFLGGRLSSDRMMLTMDKASIAGACLGLLFIPIAALSGSFAADNTVNNALLYNKFVYTGLAAGFWAAFVIGRIRLGPGLWEHRSLSALQGATAGMAILMTTMGVSIRHHANLATFGYSHSVESDCFHRAYADWNRVSIRSVETRASA